MPHAGCQGHVHQEGRGRLVSHALLEEEGPCLCQVDCYIPRKGNTEVMLQSMASRGSQAEGAAVGGREGVPRCLAGAGRVRGLTHPSIFDSVVERFPQIKDSIRV